MIKQENWSKITIVLSLLLITVLGTVLSSLEFSATGKATSWSPFTKTAPVKNIDDTTTTIDIDPLVSCDAAFSIPDSETGGSGFPTVNGPRILWRDSQSASLEEYNLVRVERAQFQNYGASNLLPYPLQAAGRMIWAEYNDDETRDIFLQERDGAITILDQGIADSYVPVLSTNNAAWIRYGKNLELIVYDFSEEQQNNILDALDLEFVAVTDLSISDTYLVWKGYREGQWSLYIYDLNSQTIDTIATDPRLSLQSLSHDGQYVVWHSYRNPRKAEIFMYNIDTGVQEIFSEGFNPYIKDEILLWVMQDAISSGYILVGTDLTSRRISSLADASFRTVINHDGHRAVFGVEGSSTGSLESIYALDLDSCSW